LLLLLGNVAEDVLGVGAADGLTARGAVMAFSSLIAVSTSDGVYVASTVDFKLYAGWGVPTSTKVSTLTVSGQKPG